MFDASIIANVLYIFDGFHTAPFVIIASHTLSRRVSNRSVALAASCSSGGIPDFFHYVLKDKMVLRRERMVLELLEHLRTVNMQLVHKCRI